MEWENDGRVEVDTTQGSFTRWLGIKYNDTSKPPLKYRPAFFGAMAVYFVCIVASFGLILYSFIAESQINDSMPPQLSELLKDYEPFSPEVCEHYVCTDAPTLAPTSSPTTPNPTVSPSISPTFGPTLSPTVFPTRSPTLSPTNFPTNEPTNSPTVSPTRSPTLPPQPTFSPTVAPSPSPTPRPTLPPFVFPFPQ